MYPMGILPMDNKPVNSLFNPYDFNGGTVVGICGDDFAMIGADTRLTAKRMVKTSDLKRLFQLTDKSVIGSCGCWCDTLGFIDVLKRRVDMYKGDHRKTISVVSTAQMISVLMYNRRFFPYYIANILVGLDSEGKGHVYSFDPLGHFERAEYGAGGSGGRMIDPILDNQIGYKNRLIDPKIIPKITKERAISLMCDAFDSACERDVQTGDSVVIKIITKDGIEEIRKELRKD